MKMDEYIRRKVLIDAIDKTDWYHINVQGRLTLGAVNEGEALYKATDIYNAIDKITVADVVEVIRCGECRYCDPEGRHCDHPMSTSIPIPRKQDDFCSHGERRGKE